MSLSFFLVFPAYSQMLSGRDRKICSKGNLSVDWLRRHRLKQRRSINSKSPAEVDIMNAFERKKRSKYGEGGRDRRKVRKQCTGAWNEEALPKIKFTEKEGRGRNKSIIVKLYKSGNVGRIHTRIFYFS